MSYTPWRAIAEAAVELQRKINKKVKIVLCGHSLAGAIAQLVVCCLQLYYENQFDFHCYSFGQPLIGDFRSFVENHKIQDVRIGLYI